MSTVPIIVTPGPSTPHIIVTPPGGGSGGTGPQGPAGPAGPQGPAGPAGGGSGGGSGFGYNMDNALREYRIALAERSASNPAKLTILGDSIVQGQFTSDEKNTSWVAVLRAELQQKYGNAGEGFINVLEAMRPPQAGSRVTLGAGWAQASGTKSGFGGGYVASNGAVTPITINFVGDKVTLIYVKGSVGGTGDVKVDGVSVGTVNCNNATVSFNNFQTFTGLSNAAHVLTITPASTAHVMMEGIIAEISASGIQVNKVGVPSYTTTDWNNTNTKLAWGGKPPHAVGIALGVNDGGFGLTTASFKTNMEAFIALFQGMGASVFLIPYMKSNASWASAWPSFVAIFYELADAHNVGVIDIYKAWNENWEWGNARGLYGTATEDFTGASGTNTVHPSDKGHRYIAEIVKQSLL